MVLAGVSPRDGDGGGDVGDGVDVGGMYLKEDTGMNVPGTSASVLARYPRPRPRLLRP